MKKNSNSQLTPKELPKSYFNEKFYTQTLDEYQINFRNAIFDKQKKIVICDARAGTGKTTIALGAADLLIKYHQYEHIYYVIAPVQEQKQGFLPGDLAQKSAPYMSPLYTALRKLGINAYTCVTNEETEMYKDSDYYICTIPHTFLRGNTLSNSIVIVEEAQNYYVDELKKVLTRVDDSCKAIVIGHSGQIDLTSNPQNSGLKRCVELFKNEDQAAVCKLVKNYRGWVSLTADNL